MEQSDSTSRVTPYELATLATRVYPERCASAPKEAISVAERLLQEANVAIERTYHEKRRKEIELEEGYTLSSINWVRALKEITGQKRRDRAAERFLEFMERRFPGESKQTLDAYKRDGFTESEVAVFHGEFMDWLKEPKRKKGKQGRRISESDGRLRTELVGLAPRKPRKPA